ncbi:glycoside hydrolase family 16 protein [Candidatus Villigracilis affinis]|uniref:glycoside hydrolase family 16 protein n=1 Tax=Candidatus Villigracilis affinis TaxID=3140682 RepID=UPI002A1DAAEE|nr:glycoside hydrolase family 16 protein [Anaerolineales bacterium]
MKRIILVILAAFLASCSSTPTPMPDLTASLPVESPTPPVTGERIIQFSGYDWVVRDGGLSGPGPNTWSGSNVWVDENGDLHLKISRTESGWTCAEVTTIERLGFGIYQFQVIGPIDQLDANVVFGMFNYPTEDVGPNATNEIDIEYAHWGNPEWPIGNFTVWPAQSGVEQTSESFPVTLNGTYTTHRFVWESQKILFQALHGHRDDNENEIANWLYKPDEPLVHISQQAMPVHINLWLFQGQPPVDGNEVEVIIHSFTFASLGK